MGREEGGEAGVVLGTVPPMLHDRPLAHPHDAGVGGGAVGVPPGGTGRTDVGGNVGIGDGTHGRCLTDRSDELG